MNHYLLYSSAIVALILVCLGFKSRAVEASIWLALAIVGQTASLLLINAGPKIHYQHFRSLDELLSGKFNLPVALLGLQTVAVIIGLVMKKSVVTAMLVWCGGLMRPWQWAAVALMGVALSATLSRELPFYGQELILASSVQLVFLATTVLFAISVPSRLVGAAKSWFGRLFGDDVDLRRRGTGRFVAGCVVWVVGVTIVLAVFSYQRHPHVPDEVSYLYHARYFAQGELTMPAPPVPAAFKVDLMTYEPNRWYSPVPPGWPLVLAVGAWFGLPWLINPLLAGVNVILTFLFVEGLYGKKTARIACLLLCASPWYLFMGMNFMTHMAALACALLSAVSVQRMRKNGNSWWGVPGGASLGLLSLIRPLDGVMIALALGLWALGARGSRFRWSPALVLAGVTAVAGGIQLPYNYLVSGSARMFPINKYNNDNYGPGVNDLGFGSNRGMGMNWALDPYPGHGLRDVAVNANLNMTALNTELFGWGVGSLLLVGMFAFSGAMKRREYLLGSLFVFVCAVQSLYWFSGGPDFGARYWYLGMTPLIVLAVRGLDWLAARADPAGPTGMSGTRVTLGVGALTFAALVTFCPWRAVDKYYHYRGMRPDIRELSAATDFGRSVVFVRGKGHPDYASAAIYNPFDLRTSDEPIYVWDRSGDVRKQVLEAYPDRPAWFVDGPSVSGRGFQVVGGPLKTADAAQFPQQGSTEP